MEKKPRNRTKNVLLGLTREQSNEMGRQVEILIKNEMNYIVNKYVRQYKSAAADTFGWNTEDLMQHIRLILWKGFATYDGTKKAKITTYLSKILYYQMGNFSKTCQANKNANSKLYFPEELHSSEETTDSTTAEDWFLHLENYQGLISKLNDREKVILQLHLVEDCNLEEMERLTRLTRPEIIGLIKSLKLKIDEHLKAKEE